MTTSPVSGPLMLGMALLLTVIGVGIIWQSASVTRKAVSRRVDLIRAKAAAGRDGAASQTEFDIHAAAGVSGPRQREAARVFAPFGVPPRRAAAALVVAQALTAGLLALLGYLGGGWFSFIASSLMLHGLVTVVFGLLGWLAPEKLIQRRIKNRSKAVVDGLPDALELLVICVEAGLAFEDGIDRIVVELRASQPALAEELALTSADLKLLPNRDDALAHLAERVPMPSVRSVVTTLTQTMRYGTPLAQALRGVASELRGDFLMKLEERANQLPALMTIPMMLFIMPTIFMIVGGPAALRIMDQMGH